MPTNMGPPPEPGPGPSSRKRKHPDDQLIESGVLANDPIENEYEHLDDDENLDDIEDEATINRKKAEYESILKAQEPATISQYGEIKITPFNLKEELEEGEIDETGNFIFRRNSPTDDEKNDTWAESIDWTAVEKKEREAAEKKRTQGRPDGDKMDAEIETESVVRDRLTCYRQLLRVMRPDETVQKTIRRLGNEVPKRRPVNNRSKARQSSQPGEGISDQERVAEARRKLDLTIEVAHHLLEDGDTDIYQKSYEILEEAIN